MATLVQLLENIADTLDMNYDMVDDVYYELASLGLIDEEELDSLLEEEDED